MPALYNALSVQVERTVLGEKQTETLWCEVAQHLGGGQVARFVARLDRRPAAWPGDHRQRLTVTVPVGLETLGRVHFNLVGEPIDDRGPVTTSARRRRHSPAAAGCRTCPRRRRSSRPASGHGPPLPAGARRQGRPLRRRRRRQDGHHPELIARLARFHGGYSCFAGVGERTREGNDLWLEMQEAKIGDTGKSVIDQTVMVFGQMNEPPGARVCASPSRRSPWPSTSATDRRRHAAVHRQHLPLHPGRLRGLRRSSAACPRRSATSRRSPPRWVSCRSASPRPSAAR